MSSKVLTMKNRKIVLIANVIDAPFKCNICRKVFINATYLSRHYERRHPKHTTTQSECIQKRKSYQDSSIKLSENVGHHSINDVLNATQRIETLLSNLTINRSGAVPLDNELEIDKINVLPASCDDEARRSPHNFLLPVKSVSPTNPLNARLNITYRLPLAENDQLAAASKLPMTSGNELNESYELPLANSTLNEIDSGSFETKNGYHGNVRHEDMIEVYSESSGFSVSHHTNNVNRTKSKENSIVKDLHEIGEKSYYDCLVAEEKNVLERIMSPKPEMNILDNLKQNITSNISTGSRTSKISCEEVSFDSSYIDEHETLGDAHKRLRLNAKSVLDSKLHLYGVNPNCQGISDEAACSIRKILISQREEVSQCNSEYNRLRDLINHNADSRIKMSIES